MKKNLIGILVLMSLSFTVFAKDVGYSNDLKFAAFDFYAPIVTDKDSMNSPQHGSIVYDTTDDAFFGLDSEGVWQTLGGSSELSNVKTPTVSSPKLVSARISNAGASDTVSNELGSWIDGNCDESGANGMSTCIFEIGTFSQAPNCTCTGISDDPMICYFRTLTSTGFTTQVSNHSGTDGVNSPIIVTCHGI